MVVQIQDERLESGLEVLIFLTLFLVIEFWQFEISVVKREVGDLPWSRVISALFAFLYSAQT